MEENLILSEDRKIVIGVKNTSITSIIIPPEIVGIGKQAFSKCHHLSEVHFVDPVFPLDGLEFIDDEAFYGCPLSRIDFPKTLKKIGVRAFSGSFLWLSFPKSLNYIGQSAFEGISSLKTIEFGGGLETIGRKAFADCTSLLNILLPANLKFIMLDAFRGCTSLQHVVLPEGLEDVEWTAFADCPSLHSIVIRNTKTDIKYNTFKDVYADSCKLYVPDGEKETYSKHPAFEKFERIKELKDLAQPEESGFIYFKRDSYTLEQAHKYGYQELENNSGGFIPIIQKIKPFKELEENYNDEDYSESTREENIFRAFVQPGEYYRVYQVFVGDEDQTITLDNGGKLTIDSDGFVEFEDANSRLDFDKIPTETLDKLAEKTDAVKIKTIEEFEQEWNNKEFCTLIAIRKTDN